tara:strand:+ start:1758 stop:3650 length:1893 start_codon:yes stop_codon:yes gene_type:complete
MMGVSLKLSINEDFSIPKESEYGNIKLINEKKEKDDEFGYFDFGGMGKIPYVKRNTKFYYLSDPIDTGKILGLSNKDEYGYYDEIFIESYDQKLKRYYPTNDWADWEFIKDKKIPFAFKTGDDQKIFHLVLKLINPTKSVVDLQDPNNKSRGWVISMPGIKSNSINDSGTGYYTTNGESQVPYNITAPVIPGDLSTFDLDSRTDFDRFMDSYGSIIVQIVVSMAVTIITRNFALGQIAAAEITSILGIQARLMIAAMVAETIVNLPVAIYYFNRPGYESMGWLSLAFILLPVIQRTTLLNRILPDYSLETAVSISQKIMTKSVGKMQTQAELKTFMMQLGLKEKNLFVQVLKGGKSLDPLLKNAANTLIKESDKQAFKSSEYLLARQQILTALSKNSESLFKVITKDFAMTYTYAKLIQTIIEQYSKLHEKNGKKIEDLTKKQKNKIAENTKKIDEAINLLPEWVKLSLNEDYVPTSIELDEEMVKDLIENGIMSDELKKKFYDVGELNMKNALIKANKDSKSLEESLGIEKFKKLQLFRNDPIFKASLTPEEVKYYDDLIAENAKIRRQLDIKSFGENWNEEKDPVVFIQTYKKDPKYETKVETKYGRKYLLYRLKPETNTEITPDTNK